MRFTTIGLLAAGLVFGACSNQAGVPPEGTPLAAAADAPAVGTGGTIDPAPAGTAPVPAVPAVVWREVTVPAGTNLRVVLEDAVGSDTSRSDQEIQARLARSISIGGTTVLPEGARVTGVVTEATQSGRVKGRAEVAMRFNTVAAGDEHYRIQTGTVRRVAPATKKKDALTIGAPAAGGAIIGGLLGGKKGALIGTAAAGGAGTAAVLATRGKEIHLAKGTALTLKLSEPVTVRVRDQQGSTAGDQD